MPIFRCDLDPALGGSFLSMKGDCGRNGMYTLMKGCLQKGKPRDIREPVCADWCIFERSPGLTPTRPRKPNEGPSFLAVSDETVNNKGRSSDGAIAEALAASSQGNDQGRLVGKDLRMLTARRIYIHVKSYIRYSSPIRISGLHFVLVGGSIAVRPILRIYVLYQVSTHDMTVLGDHEPNALIPELGWHTPWFGYLSSACLTAATMGTYILFSNMPVHLFLRFVIYRIPGSW